jgi:hypothetical protein
MKEYVKVLINSGLAGLLVTFGALSVGEPNFRTIYYGIIAGVLIAINQFKDYFQRDFVNNKKGKIDLFSFV